MVEVRRCVQHVVKPRGYGRPSRRHQRPHCPVQAPVSSLTPVHVQHHTEFTLAHILSPNVHVRKQSHEKTHKRKTALEKSIAVHSFQV